MRKVLVGGGFDLFHYAHLLTLQEAKKYGDYLIVNVLSDERLKAKKGPTRPIIPAKERMEIVMAIGIVNEVICLEGDPEYPVFKVLEMVKPNVFVINHDEFADLSQEREVCELLGIELVTIPRIIAPSGLDTSKIVKKIRDSAKW